jgi:hypothetical protein
MTGINAVGRSIFSESVITVVDQETTNVVRIQCERRERDKYKGRKRVGMARNRKQSLHVCETTQQTTQLQLSLAWIQGIHMTSDFQSNEVLAMSCQKAGLRQMPRYAAAETI